MFFFFSFLYKLECGISFFFLLFICNWLRFIIIWNLMDHLEIHSLGQSIYSQVFLFLEMIMGDKMKLFFYLYSCLIKETQSCQSSLWRVFFVWWLLLCTQCILINNCIMMQEICNLALILMTKSIKVNSSSIHLDFRPCFSNRFNLFFLGKKLELCD